MRSSSIVEEKNVFSDAYLRRAEQIFFHPSYRGGGWEEILGGAVGANTFCGFHRIDKSKPGAKQAFVGYFIDQEESLTKSLMAVRTRNELDALSDRISEALRERLESCSPPELRSYNNVRTPVDLCLEYLVAMDVNLDEARAKLVPLLFLPLDGPLLAHPALFTTDELAERGLSRSSTFSDIDSRETYDSLQQLLARKAQAISETRSAAFHVIYFDMLWNDRYRRVGVNIIEASAGPDFACLERALARIVDIIGYARERPEMYFGTKTPEPERVADWLYGICVGAGAFERSLMLFMFDTAAWERRGVEPLTTRNPAHVLAEMGRPPEMIAMMQLEVAEEVCREKLTELERGESW
jgi:hypothetical protein